MHPLFAFLIYGFIGTVCGAVGGALLTIGLGLPFDLAGPFAVGGSLAGCMNAFLILADGDRSKEEC